MIGREVFKCVHCGIEVEGREAPDGTIRAVDRAGSDPDAPPRPCVCMACAPVHRRLL